MKRLVAHYIDTAVFGGAERALMNLIGALDPDEWSSVLLHPDHPGLTPLIRGVEQMGAGSIVVPDMRGIGRVRMLSAFRQIVRSLRPQVFHAHLNWPLACSGGILSASMVKVPAVLATVQLFSPLPSTATIPIQRRLVTGRVDRYIAVSQAVARDVTDKMGVASERITVVHNGVHLPKETNKRATAAVGSRATVVTLARLDKQKGLDVLVEAVAGINDLRLVIAGEGPERQALEQLAARLGVNNRVELRGFVEDTYELLNEADLFVLPSRSEGLPLSIVEAMLVGLPVVATAIGGTDELVLDGRTGLLVPVDDAVALGEAIRRVLADREFAHRLGEQGRVVAESRFTDVHMAAGVSRAYYEVLGAPLPRVRSTGAWAGSTPRAANVTQDG